MVPVWLRNVKIDSVFRPLLVAITFSCFVQTAYCQGRGPASNWYFGWGAGIRFEGDSVRLLFDGQTNSYFSAASSISDNDGNLIFYSDGDRVFNRNHVQMPNGFDLRGSCAAPRPSLIVQNPVNSSMFYVFSVAACTASNEATGLSYAVIDLSLNGGLGDVVSKRNILADHASEGIAATLHTNGKDVWVIVNEQKTNRVFAFLVDATGVNETPVITAIGAIRHSYIAKQMKVSPDGSKIVITSEYLNVHRLEGFHFNTSTGHLSGRFLDITNESPCLYSLRNLTGVEFSSNGRFLYVSNIDSGQHNYQLDLTAGSSDAILNSLVSIGAPLHGLEYYMQLGPDGMIYIVYGGGHGWDHLSRIEKPNLKGEACKYVEGAIYLGGREAIIYLPAFIQSYFTEQPAIEATLLCVNDSVKFDAISLGQYDSLLWEFDDPASGMSNKSITMKASHLFSNPGTFNVTLKTYRGGNIMTTLIKKVALKPFPAIDLGIDTAICQGSSLELALAQGFQYQWSTGSQMSSIQVTNSGEYAVTVTNGQCVIKDSIHIQVLEVPLTSLPEFIEVCEKVVDLDVGNTAYNTVWSTGETVHKISVDQSGDYSVAIANGPCVTRDTVSVSFRGLDGLNAGATPKVAGFEEPIVFWATGSDVVSWHWDFDDEQFSAQQNVSHVYRDAGDYDAVLTAFNSAGCKDSTLVSVSVDGFLYIPNVFTPGNDEKNNEFLIQYNGTEKYVLDVYNRWGQKIFHSEDKDNLWKGENENSQVFFYHLMIGDKAYKGWVQLVR